MIKCLSRIDMVCADPEALSGFYRAAFGFSEQIPRRPIPTGSGITISLQLGHQEITLIQMPIRGRPYPDDVAGWSPLFQHVAIVVSDMREAFTRLCKIAGWSSISTKEPQRLPVEAGGVWAFKFRDTEGHPLEFIEFPLETIPAPWQRRAANVCLGIDHSAISIANTQRSIAFYEGLGLKRQGSTLNIGPEQARLDGIPNAVVEVTNLTPRSTTPHVELLAYRGDFDRKVEGQEPNDTSATRLVFSLENSEAIDRICSRLAGGIVGTYDILERDTDRALLRDPDGHLIGLEAAG